MILGKIMKIQQCKGSLDTLTKPIMDHGEWKRKSIPCKDNAVAVVVAICH